MIENIEIKNVDFRLINKQNQKEILGYVVNKVEELFKTNITKVYVANAPFLKGNYIPLEEMLAAISVTMTDNPLSCRIFIDEDKLRWEDRNGNAIHSIPFQHIYEPGFISKEVHTLGDYWQLPIDGKQEQEWAIVTTITEIYKFFQTDLVNFIRSKVVAQRSGGNGKQ